MKCLLQKGLDYNEDEIIPDSLSQFLDTSIHIKTNDVTLLEPVDNNIS